jgi:hypothetical protein
MFLPMKSINLSQIQARRKRIAETIAGHEQGISALRAEDAELDVAERVFMRLATESNLQALAEATPNGVEVEAVAGRRLDMGKPPNTPTVSDMIREALTHALSRNVLGLEPSDMLSYIRGRYWPTARSRDVGPIAWRMHSRRELEKRGQIYKLPKEEREKNQAASEVTASGSA